VGQRWGTNNNQHQHPIKIGEAIILTLDSQYAVKLLQGKCRAIENKLLINFMVQLWKFVGSIFSLRVRWSPGHDNPAKNFIQLPGTDVVDKLARIVGASANHAKSMGGRRFHYKATRC
jgi:hypothetical protein